MSYDLKLLRQRHYTLGYMDPIKQEWLNLPMSYSVCHPFTFSLGYDIRDQMLRMGWIVTFPSSLSQYTRDSLLGYEERLSQTISSILLYQIWKRSRP
jgi:hypothetical protein